MIDAVEQPQESNLGTQSSPETSKSFSPDLSNQDTRDAIIELEKMEKVKFQGQEWTPKDLEKAIMRQKDYTQKTQSVAEERKVFEQERKFYENLVYDLKSVQSNPSLASEFIKVYPEKFHSYLKDILSSNDQSQTGQQGQQQQRAAQPDIETMSRLQKMETLFHEQEVAKNEASINQTIASMKTKYPDALEELAIARVYEAHNAGQKVTPELWEKAFKQSDTQIKELVKSRYGDLVKKQTDANKRGRDVESGGATPGRAPEKFKSLKDVTNYAIQDLTRKN